LRAPLLRRGGFGGGGRLAQTLPLNVCDASQAQFGQIVPIALTCPFGTSQTPTAGSAPSGNGTVGGES